MLHVDERINLLEISIETLFVWRGGKKPSCIPFVFPSVSPQLPDILFSCSCHKSIVFCSIKTHTLQSQHPRQPFVRWTGDVTQTLKVISAFSSKHREEINESREAHLSVITFLSRGQTL